MKVLIFIFGIIGVGLVVACGNDAVGLEKYRWEKRVILSSLGDEAWAAQDKRMAEVKGKVEERDLVILRVKAGGKLAKKYGVKEGGHVLVGKDGGVKGRQDGVLDFGKWFVLIDGMPMRKREMRGEDAE